MIVHVIEVTSINPIAVKLSSGDLATMDYIPTVGDNFDLVGIYLRKPDGGVVIGKLK